MPMKGASHDALAALPHAPQECGASLSPPRVVIGEELIKLGTEAGHALVEGLHGGIVGGFGLAEGGELIHPRLARILQTQLHLQGGCWRCQSGSGGG
jgi:hypothetical protein